MTPPDATDRSIYSHWSRISIRYSDQDPQGHVNNAAFVTYTETVRVDFVNKVLADLDESWATFVLAHIAVDFIQEITYPGEVEAGITLLDVGTKSIKTLSGMFVQDDCVATAYAVNVFFDSRTRSSILLSEAALHALAMHRSTD